VLKSDANIEKKSGTELSKLSLMLSLRNLCLLGSSLSAALAIVCVSVGTGTSAKAVCPSFSETPSLESACNSAAMAITFTTASVGFFGLSRVANKMDKYFSDEERPAEQMPGSI